MRICFIALLVFLGVPQFTEATEKAKPTAAEEGLLNKLLAPGPLSRAHKELERSDCLKCHDTGKGIPDANCNECHKEVRAQVERSTGFHGLAKQSCIQCHREHKGRGFDSIAVRQSAFDHARTGFKLEAKHAKLQCADCHDQKMGKQSAHPGGIRYFGKKTDCASCHQKDDVHFFSEPAKQKDCSACHTGSESWKVGAKFEHGKETGFAIDGKHEALRCWQCHLPDSRKLAKEKPKGKHSSVYEWPNLAAQSCATCHASPHKEVFSAEALAKKCTDCHVTEGWKQRPQSSGFRHDETRFPLDGKHARVSCSQCHVVGKKQVFQFPSAERQFCNDCHKTPHVGQFSEEFLGKSCSECHRTEKFQERRTFDHTQTQFPLREKHAEAECAKCHMPLPQRFDTKWASVKHKFLLPDAKQKSCVACHSDFHQGQHGTSCASCHTERSWKLTKDFHKNFTLRGAHFSLQCAECHRDEAKLSGRSQQCATCHKKDDVHNGTLPNCATCHRQNFWEHAAFKHSLSFFPLRGTHRTINCNECHGNGIYRGTPSECIDCHRADAQRVTNPPHVLPGFANCKSCHNQFSF